MGPAKLSELVTKGDLGHVPAHVSEWLEQWVATCTPRDVHIMDGTPQEARELKSMLVKQHVMIPLPKYDNCYLVRTDPRDVARSEGRTFLSTKERRDSVPTPEDQRSQLGNWLHPDQLQVEVDTLFPGCMTGRTMYVIPFSMGPIGSPLSKIGVEITDSAYVAISMGIMTRVGTKVFQVLGNGEFVKVRSNMTSHRCYMNAYYISVST